MKRDQKATMQALLIYPPAGELLASRNNVPPLGLLAISSFIKEHCPGVKAPIFNFIDSTSDEVEAALMAVDWSSVRLIGITVMSTEVQSASYWAKEIRQGHPNIIIVAGGPHITLTGIVFLKKHKEFDAIIPGDGEKPMAQLCLALQREDIENAKMPTDIPGVVTRMPLDNSVASSLTQFELLPPAQWTNPFTANVAFEPRRKLTYTSLSGDECLAVSLVVSRGCPLACAFCSIIAMNARYRSLPPKTVIPWLLRYRKEHVFKHIYFLDADFLVSRSRSLTWAHTIYDAFSGAVTWSVQANVGHILSLDLDRLKELHTCGLQLAEIGLESGNDKQFRFFNKTNFGKIATVEQSLHAVELLRKAHIRIGIDYIMFYPELTLEELTENLTFLLRAKLIDTFDVGHYFNELILFPGTPLRNYYQTKAKRLFDPDEIPSVRQFYLNKTVLHIRDSFLNWYAKLISPITVATRNKIREASTKYQNPARRSELRLLEIKLRHQPYQILKSLIQNSGELSEARNIVKSDSTLTNEIYYKDSNIAEQERKELR